MTRTLREEYEICQLRGHQPVPGSGESELIEGGKTWYHCKWCRTRYSNHTTSTTTLHEKKVPE